MTLLYDPDEIEYIIDQGNTPQGYEWIKFINKDGMLVKAESAPAGGISYSVGEP